jgi:excisionase family DNA binding protein
MAVRQKRAKPRRKVRRKPRVTPGDVLTIDEVAAKLRIARLTAYRMARDGRLPTIRAGKRYLIPKVAFDRLLASAEPVAA